MLSCGSARMASMSDWPEGFIWGTGASSTQSEGAAPGSDWYRWEQDGPGAPVGGRQRLRHPARRGLRALRRARADPPPAVAGVGPPRADAGQARRRGGRALPAAPPGRAGRGRVDLGLPPPLLAAGLVRRRPQRLPRRQAGASGVEPPRRLGGRDLRRPRRRVEADQRARLVRPRVPPLRRAAAGPPRSQRGRQRAADHPPGRSRRGAPAPHAGHARGHHPEPLAGVPRRGHRRLHRCRPAIRGAELGVMGVPRTARRLRPHRLLLLRGHGHRGRRLA